MIEQFQSLDPLYQAVLVVLLLMLVWGILRTLFRIAAKVFTLGCAAIVLIGGLILLWAYWEALFGGG